MDYSILHGFPVLHCPLEYSQTHVHWVNDAIQPSHPHWPLLFWPSSCPASESFPVNWFLASGGQSIGASVSVFLYGPTITSVHDCWKSHSFDCMDVCQQSDVSAFQFTVQVCHSFSSNEQASFNFMATVTVCTDFGAQENEVYQRSLRLSLALVFLEHHWWWDLNLNLRPGFKSFIHWLLTLSCALISTSANADSHFPQQDLFSFVKQFIITQGNLCFGISKYTKKEERKTLYNRGSQRTLSYHFIVFPSRLYF